MGGALAKAASWLFGSIRDFAVKIIEFFCEIFSWKNLKEKVFAPIGNWFNRFRSYDTLPSWIKSCLNAGASVCRGVYKAAKFICMPIIKTA